MVGELKALRHRLLAQNKQKIAHHYDSEEELLAESDHIDRIKYNINRASARRMASCLYWAAEKGQEALAHNKLSCNLCDSCGLCNCGVTLFGHRFRCLCSEGKKMLSPFRILFLSNGVREQWRTSIHEIGVGTIPRREFKSLSADWKELNW